MLKAAPMGKLARSNEQKSLGPDRFTPSTVAVREHRTRERADRIIDQFVERFTEKDFFLKTVKTRCSPCWFSCQTGQQTCPSGFTTKTMKYSRSF